MKASVTIGYDSPPEECVEAIKEILHRLRVPYEEEFEEGKIIIHYEPKDENHAP